MAVVATKKAIKLKVNGKEHTLEVSANEFLVEVLRERLRLTGTKIGCNRGECGACLNRWQPYLVLASDMHHPTQSMADIMVMMEKLGDVRGKKSVLIWAYSPRTQGWVSADKAATRNFQEEEK